MKDIDFLPEWYKNGRRRQTAYRAQYVALAGMIAVMMVWNFLTGRAVSQAEAEIAQISEERATEHNVSQEYLGLQRRLKQFQSKAATIEKIESHVDVASILAELSYLIDDSVVLKKLDLISEPFPKEEKQKKKGQDRSIVRVARKSAAQSADGPVGKARYRIVMTGIAADGGDVMLLLSRLEESAYFFRVELSFSRNADIDIKGRSAATTDDTPGSFMAKPGRSESSVGVSEFEITCYLANYRRE